MSYTDHTGKPNRAQACRFLLWPEKIGAAFPISADAVQTVEAVRAGADYCLVKLDRQSASVIVRPDLFEALRQSAYGYAPLLTLPSRRPS